MNKKKELTKTQKFILRLIGLIGILIFSGLLGMVYFYSKGQLDIDISKINWKYIVLLLIFLVLPFLKPARKRLEHIEEISRRYSPKFFYDHPYLTLLLFFLIGFIITLIYLILSK